jgi:hypothetical protein
MQQHTAHHAHCVGVALGVLLLVFCTGVGVLVQTSLGFCCLSSRLLSGPNPPYFVCMREVGFHSKIVAVRTCTLRSVVPTYVCSS